MPARLPERIVCLTEETTETLYLLGQGHRIVGISGYTVRPPEAREKPKVCAFITAKFDKIEELKPDRTLDAGAEASLLGWQPCPYFWVSLRAGWRSVGHWDRRRDARPLARP